MPPPAARPHRDDVLVAAAGLLGGLLLWALGVYDRGAVPGAPGGAWVPLPLGAMCLAALGRRVAQPWALGAGVVALAADVAVGSLMVTVLLFTDLVYAAALYGRPRLARAVLPGSVAVTVAGTLGLLAALRSPQVLLLGVLLALVTVLPAWTGALIRDHRNAAAAQRLRAEQTALLAERDRAQAVAAERARMAREMHDVVAGHLSAIALHSTAALARTDGDRGTGGDSGTGTAGDGDGDRDAPAAAREALGVIRDSSVQGLAEMRRLIGLLRTEPYGGAVADGDSGDGHGDGAGPDVSPTLAGLDALLERARGHADAARLDFALHDGRGPGPLPVPVEFAAYRIVQESVTNALKHAAPGRVTVELTGGGSGSAPLTVRVTSPLPAPRRTPDGPRAPGAGAGLVGMRERAGLLGGTLHAGPAPADGDDAPTAWEVRAVLPVDDRREPA